MDPERIGKGRLEGMDVTVGDDFEVTLPDQPGAGYRWVAADVPAGVELAAENASGGDGSGRVGAALPRTFLFRAREPGTFRLSFRLVRPWESEGTAPAQTHEIEVVAVGAAP
jgi:inhibitor of cysteine peptidase